jgi:hypothetical protein
MGMAEASEVQLVRPSKFWLTLFFQPTRFLKVSGFFLALHKADSKLLFWRFLCSNDKQRWRSQS